MVARRIPGWQHSSLVTYSTHMREAARRLAVAMAVEDTAELLGSMVDAAYDAMRRVADGQRPRTATELDQAIDFFTGVLSGSLTTKSGAKSAAAQSAINALSWAAGWQTRGSQAIAAALIAHPPHTQQETAALVAAMPREIVDYVFTEQSGVGFQGSGVGEMRKAI